MSPQSSLAASRAGAARWLRLLLALAVLSPALARADLTKEACVEAHGQGQDMRADGKLTLARKLFITCAQAACPALVQSDCARFADELTQQQPSLSFVARDAAGRDLPDTVVMLDGRVLATRIDGAQHEVDPGRHVVRFTHAGSEQVLTIVVASGERGRIVVASFGGPLRPRGGAADTALASDLEAPRRKRPLAVAGLLAAAGATVAGGAMALVGVLRVPDDCSLSSHECAAPPGDAKFEDAAAAVRLANAGFVVGGVSALALAAGIVWYVKRGVTARTETALAPWGTRDGAGIVVRGRL